MVSRHQGTLPILLTCPHDGGDSPSGVSERTDALTPSDCTGGRSFNADRDVGTREITRRVAQRMYEVWGESPYVVIAEFQRRFVDANRPAHPTNSRNCAFVDADARKYYDEYHKRIDDYVTHILNHNGNKGFLFDIHGTGRLDEDPADVYIGTQNGATLRSDFDRRELFMRRGLVGLLRAATHTSDVFGSVFRFAISPASVGATETGAVSGGFTVGEYGRRINAIQLEHVPEIRSGGLLDILIEEYAYSLVNFCMQHV